MRGGSAPEEAVFGRWLNKRRRVLDLTQKELARRIGCSESTIRKLEGDERHPSREVATALASTLRIPAEQRAAFIRFARAGWADQPLPGTYPELEAPWLHVAGERTTGRATRDQSGGKVRLQEVVETSLGVASGGVPRARHGPGAYERNPTRAWGAVVLQPRIPESTLRPPVLVGREAIWDQMERAWATGQHIFLRGPGGIGKTRLMLDFARAKGTVALGEGNPGDQLLPLSTIRRLFRRFVARFPDDIDELPDWARVEVARYLPEAYPESLPALRGEARRLRFFEAQLLLTLALARRVSMVLGDDLHYYDRSSFEVQSWVTSEIVRRRLTSARSIASFRPDEMPRDYLDAVEHLTQGGVSQLIDVGPLDVQASARLLATLQVPRGALEPAEVLRLTGGNPMQVLEVVKAWWEVRDLKGVGDRREGVVLYAGRTIQARLGRLDAGDLLLAQTIALLQDDAPTELLAEVLEMPPLRVSERLGRLEAQNMMRDNRFVHDLLAEGARATLAVPQRRLLHARIARTLIARAGEPARIAHHLEEAGLANEAFVWRLDAAERALAQGGRIEARHWLEGVLERAPPDSHHSARAGVLLGSVLLRSDTQAAHVTFERALAAARLLVLPDLEARALVGLAQAEALGGRDAEARRHDRQATEMVGALPGRERARVLLALSEVRWWLGDFSESQERIAEAVQLEPDQPSYRLVLARSHWHLGAFEASIAELEAMLRLDPACGRLTRALRDLGQNYQALGLLEPALHWLERGVEVWGGSGDLLMEGRLREVLGATYLSAGALPRAERELVRALALFRRQGARVRYAAVQAQRGYLRCLTREPGLARDIAADGLARLDPSGNPYRRSEVLAIFGLTCALLGWHREARRASREARELAARANSHPLAVVTALRCEAEAALIRGERQHARVGATTMLELSGRLRMREHVAWARCLLADCAEGSEALEHARLALEAARAGGFLPVEARAAERLVDLGELGMTDRAAALRELLRAPTVAVGAATGAG